MPNYIDNTCKLMDEFGKWEQPAKAFYSEKHYKEALALVLMHIMKKVPIMVYEDFDMDGFGAGTSLHRFLLTLHSIVHGYKKGESEKYVAITSSDPRNGFGLTQDEFDGFRKRGYRLVITVDNGSDSEVVKKGLRGLIVLDHHPSSNCEPYILNPNTGRTDGLYYGTSGGMVVYDFILNLDRNIVKQNLFPDYMKYRSPEMMKAIRAIAAITLISDMAILDRRNREFFISAIEDGCFSPHLLPVFERLGKEPSSRKVSFNLISHGNAFGRMIGYIEEDIKKDIEALYGKGAEFNLSMVNDWLAPPRYIDGDKKAWWDKLDKVADKINNKKKWHVSDALQYYLSKHKDREPENGYIFFANDKGMPPRLTGLLANKIGAIYGMIPTVVATEKAPGHIAMSGRGYDIKDVFGMLFDDKSMPFDGGFGGHQDACGAHIVYDAERYEAKEVYEILQEHLDSAAYKLGLKHKKRKIEVVVPEPVSVYELKQLGEQYKQRCGGIDYHKRFYVPVSGYRNAGIMRFGSGYCNISIQDDGGANGRVTLLVDGNTADIEGGIFGSSERVMLVELTSSGEFGFLRSFENIESFYAHTEIMPEAANMYDTASIRAKNIEAFRKREEERMGAKREKREKAGTNPPAPQPVIVLPEDKIAEMIRAHVSGSTQPIIDGAIVFAGSEHRKIIEEKDDAADMGGIELVVLDTSSCTDENRQKRKEAYGKTFNVVVNAYLKEGRRIVLPKEGIGVANGFFRSEPVLHSLAMGAIVNMLGCDAYRCHLDETISLVQRIQQKQKADIGTDAAGRGADEYGTLKRQEKGRR